MPVAILTMSFATVITGPLRGHYLADLKIDKQVFKLLLHPQRRFYQVQQERFTNPFSGII